MERVNCEAVLPQVMKQIKHGAFLTALSGDDMNTMTIGWASLGFIWGKRILTVAVRPVRYTFGIIERAADFTVSGPLDGMDKELAFCGTNSGKNGDKLEKCGLEVFPSPQGAHADHPGPGHPLRMPDCLQISNGPRKPRRGLQEPLPAKRLPYALLRRDRRVLFHRRRKGRGVRIYFLLPPSSS